MSTQTEPSFILHWKTRKPTDISELVDKYRPRQIAQYDENGKTVRIFEPRYCGG